MSASRHRKSALAVLASDPRLKLYGVPAEAGTLFLPQMPPSLNNAFINTRRGRVKSPQYSAWLQIARLQLKGSGPWHVPGKVRIGLRFNRAGTRADIDNLQKPVLDLLVSAGRIEDDRNVVELTSRFMDLGKNAVRVRIEALGSTREEFDEDLERDRLRSLIRLMARQPDLAGVRQIAERELGPFSSSVSGTVIEIEGVR